MYATLQQFVDYNLRHCNTLIQIHILNRIQELHTFRHRALEGFASGDESHATGALVDDRGRGSFGKVVLAGGATTVDETDAPHVAVRHLVAAQIDRMIAGQFAVDALVQFAVGAVARVQGQEAAVVLGQFLLDDIRFDA